MKEKKMFVNPFSDAFLEKWQLWLDYKKEAFDFRYKGVISEQMAIKHLVELSDGDEEKAEKIMNQSIRRGWQGFFPLHETTHGNGNTKKSTPNTGENSLRSQSEAEFVRRNGEGGRQADGTNLKAV
jgi:hypothetical protein